MPMPFFFLGIAYIIFSSSSTSSSSSIGATMPFFFGITAAISSSVMSGSSPSSAISRRACPGFLLSPFFLTEAEVGFSNSSSSISSSASGSATAGTIFISTGIAPHLAHSSAPVTKPQSATAPFAHLRTLPLLSMLSVTFSSYFIQLPLVQGNDRIDH